ncbi:MAG: aminotransferase [Candidatus Tectimicrobiota bacterium]|nr:MAG: aminotransferase [Candidatus Tectomicrobia bacterium]
MTWKIPFLDLRVDDPEERRDLLAAVEAVLQHGRFILGPEVAACEQRLAAACGRTYAVGVKSGTDALFLGLKSLGIGPGDEVITASLSWIATANAIRLTGATPVFADVGDDLTMAPDSVRRLLTPRTRAIVPVHYTGSLCAMPALLQLAQAHRLLVIEDAARAFGAWDHGRPAGAFGDVACFSMNPMKVLGACGEAGLVVTNRRDVYERLLALRYNGMHQRRLCHEPSLNGRLDTLQAAILLRRLSDFERRLARRREVATWYRKHLKGLVDVLPETAGARSVYYLFPIGTDARDALRAFLAARGIEVQTRDADLLPCHPAYRDGYRAEFANAQRLIRRLLCLPIHDKLTHDEVKYVTDCIWEFFKGGRPCQ